MNFQATIEFLLVSVRLILPNNEVDEFSGPQERDVRYKFRFKPIL